MAIDIEDIENWCSFYGYEELRSVKMHGSNEVTFFCTKAGFKFNLVEAIRLEWDAWIGAFMALLEKEHPEYQEILNGDPDLENKLKTIFLSRPSSPETTLQAVLSSIEAAKELVNELTNPVQIKTAFSRASKAEFN